MSHENFFFSDIALDFTLVKPDTFPDTYYNSQSTVKVATVISLISFGPFVFQNKTDLLTCQSYFGKQMSYCIYYK